MTIHYQCRINGINFSKSNYQKACTELLKQEEDLKWLQDIVTFIQDWFSPSTSIALLSSGSTNGTPKQLSLSKTMMTASAQATCQFFDIRSNDSVLLALPAKYIAGKMMIVRALTLNLNLTAINPSALSEISVNSPYSFAAFVPYQMGVLINNPKVLSSIRTILLGGGVIPPEMEIQLPHLHTRVFHSFGMTETASHVALRRIGEQSKTYYAIKDISFSTDSNSCLQVHWALADTPHLSTRDVVELKSENSFVWLGRYDRMINSGGVNLFPEAIESKISTLIPSRYFITSETHETLGEQCILVIESNSEEINEEDLLQKIASLVSAFEKPKKIIFRKRFKETENGKLIPNLDYASKS